MPPRTLDLIRRYLDQVATPAERAELERLLREQPGVAEAFAQAARLDQELRQVLQGDRELQQGITQLREYEPPPRALDLPPVFRRPLHRPRRWPWLAAAALLFGLGLGLFLLWPRDHRPQPAAPIVLAGQVFVAGQRSEHPPAGAIMEVREGPAVVQLADRSVITFGARSKAILHGRGPDCRQLVELIVGGASFTVHPGAGTFQVLARSIRLTALATEFTVHLVPDNPTGERPMRQRATLLTVAVLAGLVLVELPESSYVLSPGDNVAFAADGEREGRRPQLQRGVIAELTPTRISLEIAGDNPRLSKLDLAKDVQVFLDGKPGKSAALLKGMLVTVEHVEGGPVTAIRAEGPSAGGEVKSVDARARTLTLLGRPEREGGPRHEVTLPVAPEVEVILGEGRKGKLDDLRAGNLVAVKTAARDGKTVVSITLGRRDGEGPVRVGPRDGEGGAMVRGTVKAIDLRAGTLTLAGFPRENGDVTPDQSYKVGRDTKVGLGREPRQLTDIQLNAPVLLTLNAERSQVVAVQLLGRGPQRLPIVRGEVKSVDAKAGTITLGGRKGDGGRELPDLTLPVDREARIVLGRAAMKLEEIPAGSAVLLTLAPDRRTVTSIALQEKRGAGERER